MVLDFFRQRNFKCTICIRSEKLDILKHYSPPEPLNYLTVGLSRFFVPALLKKLAPLFLPPSSVSLSCFILAVPMRECSGKHSCTSSTFPVAILNGTLFFFEKRHDRNGRSLLTKTNYTNNNYIGCIW